MSKDAAMAASGIDGAFSDNEDTSPFPQSNFHPDGWNIFDQLVISASWIVYPLLALRTFRIVRSVRLATRVKDLQYMVKALLFSVPKMLCICFLLALQFYTFTIVFTDLFKDGYTSADYFGSLDV